MNIERRELYKFLSCSLTALPPDKLDALWQSSKDKATKPQRSIINDIISKTKKGSNTPLVVKILIKAENWQVVEILLNSILEVIPISAPPNTTSFDSIQSDITATNVTSYFAYFLLAKNYSICTEIQNSIKLTDLPSSATTPPEPVDGLQDALKKQKSRNKELSSQLKRVKELLNKKTAELTTLTATIQVYSQEIETHKTSLANFTKQLTAAQATSIQQDLQLSKALTKNKQLEQKIAELQTALAQQTNKATPLISSPAQSATLALSESKDILLYGKFSQILYTFPEYKFTSVTAEEYTTTALESHLSSNCTIWIILTEIPTKFKFSLASLPAHPNLKKFKDKDEMKIYMQQGGY